MASIGSNSTFGKNRFKAKVHPFQTFTAVAAADYCRRISYLYKSLCHHAAHLSLSSWTKKYTHMSSSEGSPEAFANLCRGGYNLSFQLQKIVEI